MYSIRLTVCLVCLVILCNLGVYESRKVSGGGRRTTWSRPSSTSIAKPKPQPQPTFSHSDVSKLSYGHNEPSSARRPASPPKSTHTNTNSHKPSAPPADHAVHNTHQQSAPHPPANTNNNPNPSNIGWNVPQNNPGGPGTNPNANNIGWNTNNQQHTQQRVNNANAPPPYPGAPQHNQGPPPPYPGVPSHGQFGPPPPYPGVPSHGQFGAPPAYPGHPSHGQNMGPPPPYPGINTHGTNYHPNQANYPQQPGYGGAGGYHQPGYQGGYQQPGYQGGYPQQYPGGFGGAPGGYGGGGFGGLGGGGFGGGGFGGGGYGGYGGNNGMFAPKKSGISGTTLVGGALIGLTLYSLTRDRNHNHYYYPNSQPVNGQGNMQGNMQGNVPGNVQGNGQVNGQPGTGNVADGQHSFSGDQGAYTSYVGNLSCISLYNAREVSLWANNTLQDFYRQYPTQAFPVSPNGTSESLNFTIVPGEIIHNESLAITCCGTDKGPIDLRMITNGKSRDVNCIYETYVMPFRKLNFILNNNTGNASATNSTPIAASLTSTIMAANTSTPMAEITSTTTAGSTTIVAAVNATTLAAVTTPELVTETTTPTTTTTVQNLNMTTTSANVTEVPTTTPSEELTTIKN